MASEASSTYLTPSTPPPSSNSSTTIKPTLLAFHGSGSNGTIHTIQLARLTRLVKPYFNILSLDAPFPSPAGPGILPFFEGCGPYKRWLPPNEKVSIEVMRNGGSTSEMSGEVEDVVRQAVEGVRREGGQVVGLIGFSQGTKIVSGLLRAVEVRRELGTTEQDWCDFAFGVNICPSYPPPLFPPSVKALVEKEDVSAEEKRYMLVDGKIRMPSFSVLGRQDEWNWAGKGMVEKHFDSEEGKAEVVEWEMGHHYPVAQEDSERIKVWMLSVLEQVGSETAAL